MPINLHNTPLHSCHWWKLESCFFGIFYKFIDLFFSLNANHRNSKHYKIND